MTAMLSEGLPEALIERLGHNLSNDDWHKFGLHLGFSNSQLEELYPSYQNMGKCSALAWMLRKWDRIAVDTWGIKKTLRFLGSNLNLIDRRDLVEDLSLQIFEGDNVDLMNDCEEISKKLQHVCLCWKWSSNIDERLMSRIRKWQDDSKLFYKTRVFSHIKKIVEDKGIVIVTGKQGDGKTFLAEQLLLHFLYLGYELVLVNSPKEWKQRWNPNIKQIIFIDDVFGKTRAFPFGELEQWVLCGQEMSECIEGGVTKVISTVRDYIHRDTQGVVRNVEIFRHVVNVSSDEWNLTFGEKYGMLENHLQHFEVLIDKITLRKIALNDYIQGFPLRCRLFFSDQRLKRMGNNFFLDHLPQVLFDELNYLEQTEKMKYLALVMLLLSDGVLHEDTLRSSNQGRMTKVMRLLGLKSGKPHENLFETLRHEFDLPQSAGLDKLHEAVNDLTGTYIIKVGRMYRFVHECVAEAIACTFGNSRKHQTLYIALCSASELQQRVHISSSDVVPNVEMCRVVPADVSKTALATRLTDEIEQGHAADIFTDSRFFKPSFANHWKNYLLGLDPKRLKIILETRDKRGDTFPSLVARYGCIPLLKGILKITHTLNASQLLLQAALTGQTDAVEVLLSEGANINEKTNMGQTGLLLSCVEEHLKLAQFLLEKGADLNIPDAQGCYPLHIASAHGQLPIVEKLLFYGADVNARNSVGNTALYYASLKGYENIVNVLLENGADPTICNHFGGDSMLASCANGHKNILRRFLESNPQVNKTEYKGRTCLHWACQGGFTDMVRLLLEKGANVSIKDEKFQTPLHLAAVKGHTHIWRMLVHAGADMNVTDANGNTPVGLANTESKIPSLFD